MPVHHLINEIDQLAKCPYCKDHLNKNEWESFFELQHHYKETSCNKCGKMIRVKVDFEGSGHDDWKPSEDETP